MAPSNKSEGGSGWLSSFFRIFKTNPQQSGNGTGGASTRKRRNSISHLPTRAATSSTDTLKTSSPPSAKQKKQPGGKYGNLGGNSSPGPSGKKFRSASSNSAGLRKQRSHSHITSAASSTTPFKGLSLDPIGNSITEEASATTTTAKPAPTTATSDFGSAFTFDFEFKSSLDPSAKAAAASTPEPSSTAASTVVPEGKGKSTPYTAETQRTTSANPGPNSDPAATATPTQGGSNNNNSGSGFLSVGLADDLKDVFGDIPLGFIDQVGGAADPTASSPSNLGQNTPGTVANQNEVATRTPATLQPPGPGSAGAPTAYNEQLGLELGVDLSLLDAITGSAPSFLDEVDSSAKLSPLAGPGDSSLDPAKAQNEAKKAAEEEEKQRLAKLKEEEEKEARRAAEAEAEAKQEAERVKAEAEAKEKAEAEAAARLKAKQEAQAAAEAKLQAERAEAERKQKEAELKLQQELEAAAKAKAEEEAEKARLAAELEEQERLESEKEQQRVDAELKAQEEVEEEKVEVAVPEVESAPSDVLESETAEALDAAIVPESDSSEERKIDDQHLASSELLDKTDVEEETTVHSDKETDDDTRTSIDKTLLGNDKDDLEKPVETEPILDAANSVNISNEPPSPILSEDLAKDSESDADMHPLDKPEVEYAPSVSDPLVLTPSPSPESYELVDSAATPSPASKSKSKKSKKSKKSLTKSGSKADTSVISAPFSPTRITPASKQPPVFIYTSLASGTRHMVPDTRRIAAILDAHNVAYECVDLGTDARSKRIWKYRNKQDRSLPGLVRDDVILADLKELEKWNEAGQVWHKVVEEDLY